MARRIGYPAAAFALTLGLSFVFALVLAPPAEARGGRGLGRGFHGSQRIHQEMYAGGLAGDRRHANDDYVKAASAERYRLLTDQEHLPRLLEHDPDKHALGRRPDGWEPVFP
jgi:hypothetical protein